MLPLFLLFYTLIVYMQTSKQKTVKFIFNDNITFANDEYTIILNEIEKGIYYGILTLVNGVEYKICLREPIVFIANDELYKKFAPVVGHVSIASREYDYEYDCDIVLIDDLMNFYQGIFICIDNVNTPHRGIISLIKNN